MIIRDVFGEVNQQQSGKFQFKGLKVPISTGHVKGKKILISKVEVRTKKAALA